MIFDRTFEDIGKVKQILKKLKDFAKLTQSDIETLERGTITYNTLNRIENKQKELAEILEQWTYLVVPITNKSWTKEDIFNESELKRLADNTVVLREAFYVIDKAQPNPKAKYTYQDINAMEKILDEIDRLIAFTKASFKRSNTFQSGQDFVLSL
jgi:hypothetical protein